MSNPDLNFGPITFLSYDLGRAFGFMTPQEVFTMRVMAWSLPKNPVIVNVGSGAGTSGLALRESRSDATIYTVDISEGGPNGGLQNEVNAFKHTQYQLPIQILGDSKKVGHEWNKGEIDMLFIDGDHSYDGCKGDIEAWVPHVKKNGIIMLHDYTRDVWPDVKNAVDDNLKENKYPVIVIVDTLYCARKK